MKYCIKIMCKEIEMKIIKLLSIVMMFTITAAGLNIGCKKEGETMISESQTNFSEETSSDVDISESETETVKYTESVTQSERDTEFSENDSPAPTVTPVPTLQPTPTLKPTNTPTKVPSTTPTAIPTSAIHKNTIIGDPNFKPGAYKGPLMDYRKDGDAPTLGVWWWNINTILVNSGNTTVDNLLDFLIQNKVSEIYLCIDKMLPQFEQDAQGGYVDQGFVTEADVRGFVEKAGKFGIRVAALSGSARWIYPSNNRLGIENYFDKYRSYQQNAKANEKFYAMHLDVEPHQLPEFRTNRQEVMQWFADFVVYTYDRAKQMNAKLEWDIPFWLRDTVKHPKTEKNIVLGELMAIYSDTLTIMSYRDTAQQIYNVSIDQIAFAKKHNSKLILAAECYSEEGDHVSFMEEGKNELARQAKLLRGIMDGLGLESYGFAVHQSHTWFLLKDGE